MWSSMVEQWKSGTVWHSAVKQYSGKVKQCGGTVNSMVEKWNSRTVWKSKVEKWNSVAQCRTVWNGMVEQCGGTV